MGDCKQKKVANTRSTEIFLRFVSFMESCLRTVHASSFSFFSSSFFFFFFFLFFPCFSHAPVCLVKLLAHVGRNVVFGLPRHLVIPLPLDHVAHALSNHRAKDSNPKRINKRNTTLSNTTLLCTYSLAVRFALQQAVHDELGRSAPTTK